MRVDLVGSKIASTCHAEPTFGGAKTLFNNLAAMTSDSYRVGNVTTASDSYHWKRLAFDKTHFELIIAAFGSLAQLVEQQPFKLMVAGSIPARPTIVC